MITYVLMLVLAAGAAPAPTQKPASMEQLLEQVRRGFRSDSALWKDREEQFLAAKREQKKLLDEAVAARIAEERHGETLAKAFEQNEARLTVLEETLRNRLGSLGEVFGVVREVAGDTRAHIEASITSAQLPGRGEPLGLLAQSKKLPSVQELEQLWFALQQEMIESGKVVRFEAPVVDVSGVETKRQVVRVGVFNAAAGGKYLQWSPEVGKLVELARQPASQYTDTLAGLETARGDFVKVAIDPSRGAILGLLVQLPSFWQRLDYGGLVGYLIMILGGVAFVLAIVRLVQLSYVSVKVRRQQGDAQARSNNPLGRVLAVYDKNRAADREALELRLDEAVMREAAQIERFLWAFKIVAVAAPLMGLLGTITGMIQTFQVITLFGTGDPKLMAGGISEALVTTMQGLIVAIPMVFIHGWLSSVSKRIIGILDEQSAGIIATKVEASSARGR